MRGEFTAKCTAKKEKIKRKELLKIYLSEVEYGEILKLSEMAGLSLSAFGRKMCLGLPIETQIDRLARLEITRLRGDVGRLGGLLKQALAQGANKQDIYYHFKSIDTIKREIQTLLKQITP